MLCSISGTDWSGRLFSVTGRTCALAEYFRLSLSHGSERMQLLISRRLQFAHSQAVKSHQCIFSFSSPSYLRQLTSLQNSHSPSYYSHITFGGCCPDPEICGARIAQSGPLFTNWTGCCVCYCKGCVLIMLLHSDAMLWNLWWILPSYRLCKDAAKYGILFALMWSSTV